MGDKRHADLNRLVHSRLRDRAFRKMLTVKADDGTHPVVVTLRDDQILDLVQRVRAVGGSANVVFSSRVDIVSDPDDLVVIAMDVQARYAGSDPATGQVPYLRGDCTVGVFLERLHAEWPLEGRGTFSVDAGGVAPMHDATPEFVTVAS